jgi:hypothetical protein
MEVLVRSRIGFAVTAIAAASLAVGVGIATAANGATVLKCHMSLSVTPPQGSASVDQPPAQGTQYGPLHCRTSSFGAGIEQLSFNVPDTGDMVGKYAQYFGDGSVRGTFDLAPQEGSGNLNPNNFESQSWIGTLKVTGGTGAFKGIAGVKGRKGLGVFKCNSPDSVHLTCTEKVRLSAI